MLSVQVHEANMAYSSDNRVALLNEVTKRNAPSKSGAASMAANLVSWQKLPDTQTRRTLSCTLACIMHIRTRSLSDQLTQMR